MRWQPAENRYETMIYNRCGRSGLKLPAISLGPVAQFRRRHAARDQARDLPQGLRPRHHPFRSRQQLRPAARLGRDRVRRDPAHRLRRLSRRARDLDQGRLRMWPGPYGEWGSRKYLLASLDQSLKRMGLDYVDIFYSHRFDPETPLEETMGALDQRRALRQGALCRHLLLQFAAHPRGRRDPRRARHALPHPSAELFDAQPLGRGRRPARYAGRAGRRLDRVLAAGAGHADRRNISSGIPADSRAAQGKSLRPDFINDATIANIRALNEIAERRGQTLAQMALAWVLRGGRVTSALIGASRPEQVEDCVGALAAGLQPSRARRDRPLCPRGATSICGPHRRSGKAPSAPRSSRRMIRNPILRGFNPRSVDLPRRR